MPEVRQDELCHRHIIYPELMQLPGMDFYISNKAFIFLFFFSLDPPNSSHYISRTV